jgi:hypothetical protein
VLINSGNKAPRKTTATFDQMPMPNHSINSGRKTSRGVALNAVMNGSTMALSVGERPSNTPSGKPTTMASRRPIAKADALTPSGAQMLPVANMVHNVPAIWLGTVKNSFVPAFIGTKSGRNCQTSSRRTIVPVPRMVGSKRRHTLLRGAASSSAATVEARITSVAWISVMA